MLAGTPVILLREGTERAKGPDAQHENILAARALAESIRSTLGPRGRDKMLVEPSRDVVITNDGATILKTMEIDHPAAKMIAEVAKAQDQECGDGTKTSVILTGELMKKAEELLDERVHPTVIVEGYRRAAAQAVTLLGELARPVRREEEEVLRQIAMTAMISKGVAGFREDLARLAVQAVLAVVQEREGRRSFDRKNIQIVRRQGERLTDSELIEGHVVEKEAAHSEMPRVVADARIALLEAPLEVKKTEYGAEIRITAPAQLQAFLDEEARQLTRMVELLVRSGANVVLTEKGIDDLAAEHLAKAGVYAVKHVKRSDLELLAKATGAHLVDRPQDVAPDDLGRAARVEERTIGEDKLTVVVGCPHARAVTLLLRGGSEHVVEEAERSMVDAVSTVGLALEDGHILTGAGAAAVELALRLRDAAPGVAGREQMAFRAFADALEIIPTTLAENAGMDPMDALIELRRRHKAGEVDAGVDVLRGRIGDMRKVAVEPVRVGRQALQGATDTAAMLLRIDDVIAARRGKGAAGPHPPAPGAFGEV